MAQQTRENIKSNFQSGDIPTEGNYIDLIDSSVSIKDHNSGSIVISGSLEIKGSQNVDLLIAKKLKVKGSDVTIENGHISMSGNLVATGSISASGNIIADDAAFQGKLQVGFGGVNTDGILIGGDDKALIANIGGLRLQGDSQNPTLPGTEHVTIDAAANVTASGNISSSGNIVASNLEVPSGGKIIIDGNSAGAYIDSPGANQIDFSTSNSQKMLVSANLIRTNVNTELGDSLSDFIHVKGQLTASGNISASGNINAKDFSVTGISVVNKGNLAGTDFIIIGDQGLNHGLSLGGTTVTIAGPISASNDISGSNITTASLARVESKDLILDDVKLTTTFTELNYLDGLTSNEANQIKNINSETISNTQWGYVGNMNQNVKTSSEVAFNKVSTPELRLPSASSASNLHVFAGGKVNITPTANNFSIPFSMPSMALDEHLFGNSGCLVNVSGLTFSLKETQIIITSDSIFHLFSVITHIDPSTFVINAHNPTGSPVPGINPVNVYITFIPTF